MGRPQGTFAMISNFNQKGIKSKFIEVFKSVGIASVISGRYHQSWNSGKSRLYFCEANQLEWQMRGLRFDSLFIDIKGMANIPLDSLEVLIASYLKNNATVFVSEIKKEEGK